ncbi:hypothetical protein NKG05_13835 [Oerskovia sp. M15]
MLDDAEFTAAKAKLLG